MKLIKSSAFSLIFFLLMAPVFLFGMSGEEFSSWWKVYRENSPVPPELKIMEDYAMCEFFKAKNHT